MTPALLEIIATDTQDAIAAERGGADRLELCGEMGKGGVTPVPALVAEIRHHVELPLRVMLRLESGFAVGATDLRRLLAAVPTLVDAGADGFVLGFLNPRGELDRPAIESLADAFAPMPWTLHHAFDHARDPRQTWEEVLELPQVDAVLTGGGQAGLPAHLPRLAERAAWQNARVQWLAGGGVDAPIIAVLRRAGLSSFHCGRAARHARSWVHPVEESSVRALRAACDQPEA